MVNPERPDIKHHVSLGFGADYITETGQICIGNKQVSRLGFQASVIFELLVNSRGTVSIRQLVQADGSELIGKVLMLVLMTRVEFSLVLKELEPL